MLHRLAAQPMISLRLFRLLALVSPALAGACTSVEWQPPPTPDVTWRSASLHAGEACGVVAADAGEAEEVYAFFEELLQAMDAVQVARPGPTLLVTMETGSEPLFDGFDEMQRTLARWHGQAGDIRPIRSGPDEPEVPFELVAPLVVMAPPANAPELGLPDAWRQLYENVLVVPSEAVRRDVTGRMLDQHMEVRDTSFGEWLLFISMWPIVSGKVYARLRREHQKQAARVLLQQRGLGDEVYERLGVALGEEPVEPYDPGEPGSSLR